MNNIAFCNNNGVVKWWLVWPSIQNTVSEEQFEKNVNFSNNSIAHFIYLQAF